jgi:hypothetical protein
MTDAILYWNAVALEANRISHSNAKGEQTGPTLSARALAIVHLAMYDAFAGITNTPATLPFYLPAAVLNPIPGPPASRAAAVAAAAHATLSALFPSQRAYFDLQHAAAGLSGPGLAAGHAFGLRVAAAVLADRADDPDAGDNGYASSMQPGAHRPDPDNPLQGYHGPFYGACKLFASQTRFTLDKPPDLGSPAYNDALREVRGKGIAPALMGTVPSNLLPRTAEETLIGIFWGYDGARLLGTPPRFYNDIVRTIAIARANSEEQNAQLFAMVNAAMGDAGILAWAEKYRHDLWRPVVGIREADASMGPAAANAVTAFSSDCDPSWLPLGAPSTNGLDPAEVGTAHDYPCQHIRREVVKNFTPPFPAYPSGHATFGAAAFHVTRLFYGVAAGNRAKDDLFDDLEVVSEECNGINRDNNGAVRPRHARSFKDGLWQMIEENGRSRVYLGVHWVFDAFAVHNNGKPDFSQNVGGVPLGLNIAEDLFAANGGKGPKKSTV